MGVPVEAGEHMITLTYHTPYLMAGICLSAIGILILAGYLIIRRKNHPINNGHKLFVYKMQILKTDYNKFL